MQCIMDEATTESLDSHLESLIKNITKDDNCSGKAVPCSWESTKGSPVIPCSQQITAASSQRPPPAFDSPNEDLRDFIFSPLGKQEQSSQSDGSLHFDDEFSVNTSLDTFGCKSPSVMKNNRKSKHDLENDLDGFVCCKKRKIDSLSQPTARSFIEKKGIIVINSSWPDSKKYPKVDRDGLNLRCPSNSPELIGKCDNIGVDLTLSNLSTSSSVNHENEGVSENTALTVMSKSSHPVNSPPEANSAILIHRIRENQSKATGVYSDTFPASVYCSKEDTLTTNSINTEVFNPLRLHEESHKIEEEKVQASIKKSAEIQINEETLKAHSVDKEGHKNEYCSYKHEVSSDDLSQGDFLESEKHKFPQRDEQCPILTTSQSQCFITSVAKTTPGEALNSTEKLQNKLDQVAQNFTSQPKVSSKGYIPLMSENSELDATMSERQINEKTSKQSELKICEKPFMFQENLTEMSDIQATIPNSHIEQKEKPPLNLQLKPPDTEMQLELRCKQAIKEFGQESSHIQTEVETLKVETYPNYPKVQVNVESSCLGFSHSQTNIAPEQKIQLCQKASISPGVEKEVDILNLDERALIKQTELETVSLKQTEEKIQILQKSSEMPNVQTSRQSETTGQKEEEQPADQLWSKDTQKESEPSCIKQQTALNRIHEPLETKFIHLQHKQQIIQGQNELPATDYHFKALSVHKQYEIHRTGNHIKTAAQQDQRASTTTHSSLAEPQISVLPHTAVSSQGQIQDHDMGKKIINIASKQETHNSTIQKPKFVPLDDPQGDSTSQAVPKLSCQTTVSSDECLAVPSTEMVHVVPSSPATTPEVPLIPNPKDKYLIKEGSSLSSQGCVQIVSNNHYQDTNAQHKISAEHSCNIDVEVFVCSKENFPPVCMSTLGKNHPPSYQTDCCENNLEKNMTLSQIHEACSLNEQNEGNKIISVLKGNCVKGEQLVMKSLPHMYLMAKRNQSKHQPSALHPDQSCRDINNQAMLREQVLIDLPQSEVIQGKEHTLSSNMNIYVAEKPQTFSPANSLDNHSITFIENTEPLKAQVMDENLTSAQVDLVKGTQIEESGAETLYGQVAHLKTEIKEHIDLDPEDHTVPEHPISAADDWKERSLYGNVHQEKLEALQEKDKGAFQWSSVYEASLIKTTNDNSSDNQCAPHLGYIQPLCPLQRPLRVGLSRKQKVRPLHEKL